jgi:predicted amidophosphoribosyltransferase
MKPPAVCADPDLAPFVMITAKHRGMYSNRFWRWGEALAVSFAELLALISPVDCVCCGAEDSSLCGGCERAILRLTRAPFRAEGQAPALMDVDGSVILPVVAAAVYREEMAQAVLSFKRHGQHQLENALAKGLGRAIRASLGNGANARLVPVPSSAAAYRKRGFSPIHLLLHNLWLHGELGGFVVVDALRKSGGISGRSGFPAAPGMMRHSGQKGLGRGQRARRVRGSMVSRTFRRRLIRGQTCIIVDDVLTTGATLAEAARAVHAAGGIVVGAVVLSATRAPDAGSMVPEARQVSDGRKDLEKNKRRKDE